MSLMSLDQMMAQLRWLSLEDLRRLQKRVNEQIAEEEFLCSLEKQGMLTRPQRDPSVLARERMEPIKIEGEPLSEQIIRERR